MVCGSFDVSHRNGFICFTDVENSFRVVSSSGKYGYGFRGEIWVDGSGWRVAVGGEEYSAEVLEYDKCSVGRGFDYLGRYLYATYRWVGDIDVCLEFRLYENSYVLFVINVDGICRGEFIEVDFPRFSNINDDLWLAAVASAYPRIWPFIKIFEPPKAFDKFKEFFKEKRDFMPVWIYSEEWSTVVLPANYFIDYRLVNDEGLVFRLSGKCPVEHVEAKALLCYSDKGPAETLLKAGDLLKKMYGKVPLGRDYYCFKYLGYSTANGSYYFNRFNEKTVLKVIEYLEEEEIPVKWFQLDVMWYKCVVHPDALRTLVKYFKGKFIEGDGLEFINEAWAIRELKPDEKYFPEGFRRIKMPIGVWFWTTRFARDSPYVDQYLWNKEECLPVSKDFWLDVAKRFKEWGVIWVETDNLCDILGRKGGLEEIGAKEKWLLDIFDAFSEYGIPVQLCMTPSVIYPVALKSKGACFVRTGDDFRLYPDHVKLYQDFYNSALAWAFGMYPCFDVFYTSDESYIEADKLTAVDWGFPEVSYITIKDANTEFQLLAHALSCGVVYIGDPRGAVNKEALMRLCYTTGEVIKPDRPAVPVKTCFLKDPLKGETPLVVYTTLEKHVLIGVFNLVDSEQEYTISLEEIGAEGEYYDYEYYSGEVELAESEIKRVVGGRKCQLHILAPKLETFAVIGDTIKYITPHLIKDIKVSRNRLVVATKSPDPAVLATVAENTPKEILVDNKQSRDYSYTAPLLKIPLPPGKHVVKIAV